ncbi:hypothetical protein RMB13_02300 [Acinetobacter sp. V102_4]|uniref:hypothetical protein n=1 Tax=Acinetobacter sp. V102_4 TaxID=3072984 RepID=UPI00287EB351|nr:hypothetical protein [Acinetobacter sp. V102_4]MDS7928321.1 hypothetical protein [Acinetobacter sp. V102_4]
MHKDFENISSKNLFNIKYIIVCKNTDNIPEILEKILHFPWDVREIFDVEEETLSKLIEKGIIFPNYIVIDEKNSNEILNNYKKHLFTLVIKTDNINVENIDPLSDIFLRINQNTYNGYKISLFDVINFSDLEKFNIYAWLRNKTYHFSKILFRNYLDGYEGESKFIEKINNLSENKKSVLDQINFLTEEMNQGLFKNSFEIKKIDFNEVISNKEFFLLTNNKKKGLIIHSFEDKYYYYGKYSRVLLREEKISKERKKLALTKINSIHSVDKIKHEIMFPLFYSKINNYLFYSLDYDINRVRQEVNLISSHCRRYDPASPSKIKIHNQSLSHLVNNLNIKVKKYKEVNELVENLKDKDSYYNLKSYSTLPLGWLNIDGCPLCLRHHYSLVPRNKNQLVSTRELLIVKDSAFKILIIRSFDDYDHLKYSMEKTLDMFTSTNKKYNLDDIDFINEAGKEKILNYKNSDIYAQYRFVDVDSEDDLISTLNNSTENIIIFDCHGTTLDDKGNYGLYLYGEKVSLDSLKTKINKLPPIVIFSSCDSLPMNANQDNSTAQTAIDLGARVVIGTYLPIDGFLASIAVSRLIHRLKQYVDIALKHVEKLSFSNIFQGWMLMSYTFEVLKLMENDKLIKDDDFSKIHLEVNCIINPLHPNWFEKFLEILQKNIQIFSNRDDVLNYLWSNIAITDSMKYVCLGFPEKVYIVNNINQFDSEIYDII